MYVQLWLSGGIVCVCVSEIVYKVHVKKVIFTYMQRRAKTFLFFKWKSCKQCRWADLLFIEIVRQIYRSLLWMINKLFFLYSIFQPYSISSLHLFFPAASLHTINLISSFYYSFILTFIWTHSKTDIMIHRYTHIFFLFEYVCVYIYTIKV